MTIQISRVEIAFAASLAVYAAASFFASSGVLLLLSLVVAVLGLITAVRISRIVTRQLLWRLRNRLITAYIFIGLVPTTLFVALAASVFYLVLGQMSYYLIRSEIDRRLNSLEQMADFLANPRSGSSSQPAPELMELIGSRFPNAQVLVEGASGWRYPENATIAPPAGKAPESPGLAMNDGVICAWAHVQHQDRRVTMILPITRDFLGALVPGLGEVTMLNPENSGTLRTSILQENNDITQPAEAPPVQNRLAPALNRFDVELRWGSRAPVLIWPSADRFEEKLIGVRTRPSAVLRVLSQRTGEASDLLTASVFFFAALFLTAQVVSLFIGISITRTITAAVHELYEGTVRVMSGDFSHRIPIAGRDQLGELSSSFNQMTENVQRLLTAEKENQKLQADLEIAREVQSQLYPRVVPETPTLRLTARCDPARMVSGDYYDYQQLDENRVALTLGDVAGKGISAALLMATLQSTFRAYVKNSLERATSADGGGESSLSRTAPLVTRVNQHLHAFTAPEKYATFFLGIYDERSSSLTYTNAGHLPPILVRNGETSRLDVNGLVVGAFPFAPYDESSITLEQGDLLVFFTDGITEPENTYGEMFGEERLTDLVVRHSEATEEHLAHLIFDAVHQWTGAGELQDDMTLLLLRRR